MIEGLKGKSFGDTLPRTPFCLIRHGETEWNRLAKIAGQQDVPLNAQGRAQAQAAAEQLGGAAEIFQAERVVSSPLTRARETAEIIAAALQLPVALEPDMQACAWGVLEGAHPSRIDWAAWARDGLPQGMEHPDAFKARMLQGLHRALEPGVPTLIVGHAEGCRVILNALGAHRPTLSNGAIFVFRPPEKAGVPWFVYPLVVEEVAHEL